MNRLSFPRFAPALAILALLPAFLRADGPAWGKAAENKIYAQRLINSLVADHPGLVMAGIHALAPGAAAPGIVASTLDRIGAPDDEGDLSVGVGGRTILVPHLKNPTRCGLLLPLKDASGNRIGALALAFRYPAAEDEVKTYLAGVAIRNDLAKQIPNLAALFSRPPG
ncbi:hypothetical protein [Opitutus sp. GAS368]|uniref:hypothetical protein n=1 Tax=Opitutus sp. GAS368 TaxID=1882749 RepID=UPI00087B63B9|nr:hypothetical protein [Opitutus sp. GAS368]SDS37495.1 hypothetical protein SAMN05444173_2707 [Opitutus sp. GAS368]